MTKKKAEKNSPLHDMQLALKAWKAGQVTTSELMVLLSQERVRTAVNSLLYDIGPHKAPPSETEHGEECATRFGAQDCDCGVTDAHYAATVSPRFKNIEEEMLDRQNRKFSDYLTPSQREFDRTEICRIFDVPEHLVSGVKKSEEK